MADNKNATTKETPAADPRPRPLVVLLGAIRFALNVSLPE